jgi:hypothetical protein
MPYQHTGQNHNIETANEFSENVVKFLHLGMTETKIRAGVLSYIIYNIYTRLNLQQIVLWEYQTRGEK